MSRNELKVEKLELLPQVALLCPCPRLAQGRIMKGKSFPKRGESIVAKKEKKKDIDESEGVRTYTDS